MPLGILTSGEKFITICYHNAEMIEDFIHFSRRKSFQQKSANDLILHLMISSSVWFMKYLKRLNVEIKDAENNLQKSIRNEELLEMMRIERTLVYFITSLRGNELLLQKFKSTLPKSPKPFDEDLLEDVEIEMQQARTTANVHSDILTGMMDAFASVISNNLNVVMKRLTSISIVLMFPTLIASFFGMNLEKSSEIWTFQFFAVIVASLILSAIGVWFFRRRNWL
jgi:magnesium transporter